jgi:hypothetical protein
MWRCLPLKDATETLIQEWPEANEWAGKTAPVSLEEKIRLMKLVDESAAPCSKDSVLLDPRGFLRDFTDDTFEPVFDWWRYVRDIKQATARIVVNPSAIVPVGLTYRAGTDFKPESLRVMAIATSDVAYWLYQAAPSAKWRAEVIREYCEIYKMKESARDRLTDNRHGQFFLHHLTIQQFEAKSTYGITWDAGFLYRHRPFKKMKAILDEREKYFKDNKILIYLGDGWIDFGQGEKDDEDVEDS